MARPLATSAASLLVVLGLGLPLAASAQDAPPTGDPAGEGPAAPAPDVVVQAVLTGIDGQLDKGDGAGAADKSWEVANDPAMSAARAGAWVRLGAALEAQGHPYAALAAAAEGLSLDGAAAAQHRRLVQASEAVSEDAWFGGLIGRDFSKVPPSLRTDVAVLAARHHVARGSWGTALGLLQLVDDASPKFLDAQVLEGVSLSQQSRYEEALVPFLTSIELARRADRDDHYVNVLEMNAARTFYAAKNFGRAIEYYDRVDRGDASWPQAHFESAWAFFAADDMTGTLGRLETHASPFLDDWYFPEADLLRAQALFLLCKFPGATQAIDTFQADYEPLRQELAQAAAELDAASALDDARARLEGRPTRIPLPLLRRVDWDRKLSDTLEALAVGERDLAWLRGSGKPWAAPVADALQTRLEERRRDAGQRVLDQVRDAAAELDEMLKDIELTRIDLLSLEADLYARAAVTGEDPFVEDRIGRLRTLRRKGQRVWPFQGEYWADELGWYQVQTRPECPENLRSR